MLCISLKGFSQNFLSYQIILDPDLTGGDEKTNWRWIVILEPPQISGGRSAHLVTDCISRWTLESINNCPGTRCTSHASEVSLGASDSVISRAGSSCSAQLLKIDGSGSKEGIGGGLEHILSWEEEDEGTGLGSV